MSVPKLIAEIPIDEIRSHYDKRLKIHGELSRLLKNSRAHKQFAELAVGITDNDANYSAAEHNLGPRILSECASSDIASLAHQLQSCRPDEVPLKIRDACIPFLKISVGSEIAMMLRPDQVWVANTRSIWGYLLVKHSFNLSDANHELSAYRRNDYSSEMRYEMWNDIFCSMRLDFERLANFGTDHARAMGTPSGKCKYLWADAVANALYIYHAGSAP